LLVEILLSFKGVKIVLSDLFVHKFSNQNGDFIYLSIAHLQSHFICLHQASTFGYLQSSAPKLLALPVSLS